MVYYRCLKGIKGVPKPDTGHIIFPFVLIGLSVYIITNSFLLP
jgi:hypothetical protein